MLPLRKDIDGVVYALKRLDNSRPMRYFNFNLFQWWQHYTIWGQINKQYDKIRYKHFPASFVRQYWSQPVYAHHFSYQADSTIIGRQSQSMSNRSYLRNILYLYITTLDKSTQFSKYMCSQGCLVSGRMIWIRIERDALSLWVQNPLSPAEKKMMGASHKSNQSKT